MNSKCYAIYWLNADNFAGIVLTDKDLDEAEIVKQWLIAKNEIDLNGRWFAVKVEPVIL